MINETYWCLRGFRVYQGPTGHHTCIKHLCKIYIAFRSFMELTETKFIIIKIRCTKLSRAFLQQEPFYQWHNDNHFRYTSNLITWRLKAFTSIKSYTVKVQSQVDLLMSEFECYQATKDDPTEICLRCNPAEHDQTKLGRKSTLLSTLPKMYSVRPG